jgi:hypothetical protein
MRPHGYGRFNLRRRSGEYAHRRVWEECFGLIPDGMVIHHRCANKACVNPEHLELTTPEEHADSAPGLKRSQTHCVRGHEFTATNTLRGSRGSRVCRACNRDRCRARAAA